MVAISNLNLVVSKTVNEDVATEASYLVDDMMIESVEVTVKTITGEVVKLNVLDWSNGELEVC